MTYRPQVREADRAVYAKSAALENIQYQIRRARASLNDAEREVKWLVALEAERRHQIETGEWP